MCARVVLLRVQLTVERSEIPRINSSLIGSRHQRVIVLAHCSAISLISAFVLQFGSVFLFIAKLNVLSSVHSVVS